MTEQVAPGAEPDRGRHAAKTPMDWHEVVHSEHFGQRRGRHGKVERDWDWRHGLVRFSRSVAPLLLTAVALTMALLTLVGLVARPFPWSPPPIFGGGSAPAPQAAAARPADVAALRSAPTVSVSTSPIASPAQSAGSAAPGVAGAGATPIDRTAGSAASASPAAPTSASASKSGVAVAVTLPGSPVLQASVQASLPSQVALPLVGPVTVPSLLPPISLSVQAGAPKQAAASSVPPLLKPVTSTLGLLSLTPVAGKRRSGPLASVRALRNRVGRFGIVPAAATVAPALRTPWLEQPVTRGAHQ